MKEKKYFCDWLNGILKNKWFYITIIILCVISCIVMYNVCKIKYSQELDSYSEDDYIYLTEIANSIYDKEAKAIISNNIPDNVEISDITFNDKEIKFTCILNKNYLYTPNPRIFVTITDNFKDMQITALGKESSTSPLLLYMLSICYGLLIVLIPMLLLMFIAIIFFTISFKKKYKTKYISWR